MRVAIVCLSLLAICHPGYGQEPRIFPETFDLATPEKAVASFVAAYAEKDYFASYFMLSPAAKEGFMNAVYRLNFADIVIAGTPFGIEGSALASTASGADDRLLDMAYDGALQFDDLLFHAHANGQLPFNLDAAVVDGVIGAEDGVVSIGVTTSAIPRDLIFETIIMSNGTWRIHRIGWSGSDPEAQPWGLAEGKSKSGS